MFSRRTECGVTLSKFNDVLQDAMRVDPTHWKSHYHGDDHDLALKLKYSFSDRCRYYLPQKEVEDAIDLLICNIDSADVPLSVLQQYMPIQYLRVRSGKLPVSAAALIKDRIKDCISDYVYATRSVS
jgi:D-tagatose-1,6-bisphosphate aldolase subunit GatZ/KbaZ